MKGLGHEVHLIYFAVIKGFNQSKAAGSERTASADKTTFPDTNLLAEKKLLGDMKNIKSLRDSGMSGVFTGQAVSSLLCYTVQII